MPDRLDSARRILSSARQVMILTGAGVSAESGVPTFRGPDGLWKSFRPEDLATPEAFARDPELCWEWYGWRRELVARCRPNAAHLTLAKWLLSRTGLTLVTQNVDGLHELAARTVSGPKDDPARAMPLRLHGSIFHVRCTRCSHRGEHRSPIGGPGTAAWAPACPACGALLRPDVVWFGELLPAAELRAAEAAAAHAEVCLVIGTQGSVYPAAGLVHLAKREAGARVIVIDPGETALDEIADVRLVGKAGELTPQIM